MGKTKTNEEVLFKQNQDLKALIVSYEEIGTVSRVRLVHENEKLKDKLLELETLILQAQKLYHPRPGQGRDVLTVYDDTARVINQKGVEHWTSHTAIMSELERTRPHMLINIIKNLSRNGG